MSTKPSAMSQRGVSIIELIMFIVIISVALAGILLVMNQVMRHSADPLLHKQAIAAAESLLEEIELQDFVSASSPAAACPQNKVTTANRTTAYHIVCDYDGFSTGGGIFSVNGAAPIVGLENYNATVTVTPSPLDNIGAASAVLITVTVIDPLGPPGIQISGYRTAY